MEAYTESVILQGQTVRLEPLNEGHAEAIFHVSRDPLIWEWLTRAPFKDIADAKHWVNFAEHMHIIGDQLPFAIIDIEKNIPIGSTRFLNISEKNKCLEIGWTWLAPKYWKSRTNTEAKYLLLKHVFDTLGVYRVQFITDNRNIRAQKAIEALGATREGVLRSERITHTGHRRDSVYYSILDYEWPNIRLALQERLI
jgi:N-acetyltransferase